MLAPMGRHIAYGRYLLRHKWFVTKNCFAQRLYWRGLKHDISKFRLREWIPYARFFYDPDGSPAQRRDDTGYYKPTDTGNRAFDMAWLHHQKLNDHHWQFWILPGDEVGIKILSMPDNAWLEMLCDWKGASEAQGYGGTWEAVNKWYSKNKSKMQLHSVTRSNIETFLAAQVAEEQRSASTGQ